MCLNSCYVFEQGTSVIESKLNRKESQCAVIKQKPWQLALHAHTSCELLQQLSSSAVASPAHTTCPLGIADLVLHNALLSPPHLYPFTHPHLTPSPHTPSPSTSTLVSTQQALTEGISELTNKTKQLCYEENM